MIEHIKRRHAVKFQSNPDAESAARGNFLVKNGSFSTACYGQSITLEELTFRHKIAESKLYSTHVVRFPKAKKSFDR